MAEHEKIMYIQKLKIEIEEYQHRETAYDVKRRELFEIEQASRILAQNASKRNKSHVDTEKDQMAKIKSLK